MGESESRAVEHMLTSSMQSALDGFRQNAFSLTFPAGDEGRPGAGAAADSRKRGLAGLSL